MFKQFPTGMNFVLGIENVHVNLRTHPVSTSLSTVLHLVVLASTSTASEFSRLQRCAKQYLI